MIAWLLRGGLIANAGLAAWALAGGRETVGGLSALLLVSLVLGAPVAFELRGVIRSRSALVSTAVALSFAINSLASQSLVWFGYANRIALLLTASIYGLVLSLALAAAVDRYAVD